MSYDTWDADNDGILSQEEFNEGIAETGVYSDWDTDATAGLNEEEFYGGAYNVVDQDDDGVLAEQEYGEYQDDDDWLF